MGILKYTTLLTHDTHCGYNIHYNHWPYFKVFALWCNVRNVIGADCNDHYYLLAGDESFFQ